MKVYKTIGKYFNHTGTLSIKGKRLSFTLGGGNAKMNIPGRYSTNDVNIQAAIENHGDYKKRFILEFDDKQEKIIIPAIPIPNASSGIVDTEAAEAAKLIKHNPPTIEPDIQPGIHTLGQVRDYLVLQISGLTYKEVTNSARALDFAEKHNIQFPEWEKWKEWKEAK